MYDAGNRRGFYADLAKETYKPLEGYVAKITPAKQLVGDIDSSR